MYLPRALATLVALALTLAPAAAQAPKKNFLWKVEAPSGSVAYLLGSIHLLTADYYPLDPTIYRAFAASKTLVEEVDLDEMSDPTMMMAALAKAMLTDGRTLQDVIAPATYAEVVKRAEKAGLPMMAVQRMKPWLVSIALMLPSLQAAGFTPENGVDRHFFDRAKLQGKKRQALETLTYQLDRFDEMPMPLQEEMLKSTIADLDTQVANVTALAQAWSTGNVADMEKLMLASLRESQALYERLLVERNRNWIAHIDACLKENSGCFVVVGAAHLIGPDGVPVLLEKKGYKVSQQ